MCGAPLKADGFWWSLDEVYSTVHYNKISGDTIMPLKKLDDKLGPSKYSFRTEHFSLWSMAMIDW